MERVKWTDRIRNEAVPERVGEERMMLKLTKKGKGIDYLTSEWNEGDNSGEMSPGSSTDSYPAFAHIGLRENRGKNLNQGVIPENLDLHNTRHCSLTENHNLSHTELVCTRSWLLDCCQPTLRSVDIEGKIGSVSVRVPEQLSGRALCVELEHIRRKYLPPSMLSQNGSLLACLDLMGNRDWEQKTGLFLLKARQIRTSAAEVCDAN
ncbi:hypothetical protein ANN_17070 [Periplaneta americana]|uniref:Uncharacterized protein n=1 Tax=Periplaneta americana TaxID=6978 RepID=A0ABQ8SSP4_PERAM|nr:hypothetical protein ANN_17070 [Periplaneta americana]